MVGLRDYPDDVEKPLGRAFDELRKAKKMIREREDRSCGPERAMWASARVQLTQIIAELEQV